MAHDDKDPALHNQYLQKRRQGWYFRLAVLPSLVPAIGKTHIVRSLKTRDPKVARERRWEYLAEARRLFAECGGPWGRVDPVDLGLEVRQAWAAASDSPAARDPETGVTPRLEVQSAAEETALLIEEAQGREAARKFFNIATSGSSLLAEVSER